MKDQIPQGLNHILITLVPKIQSPKYMYLFWPISLCSTLYKIIIKIIVSRIRPFLRQWIRPCQVSFVPDRHMSYNILITREILHKKCRYTNGKKGYMVWKLIYQKLMTSSTGLLFIKSSLSCSCLIISSKLKNTSKNLARSLSNINGSPLTSDLGLLHSRVRNTYSSIIDKVSSRLAGWKSKTLNMAGRLTTIQAVTASIPVYSIISMRTTELPSLLLHVPTRWPIRFSFIISSFFLLIKNSEEKVSR